jgi:hypothetical protein
MKIRYFTALILLVTGFAPAVAQGKKTIREKEISSITVKEYFIGEGMDEAVVESIETFNSEGDLVQLQEFNKKGEIKKWEKYGYDGEGNLVEEVFLDEKGKITRTEKTVYRDDLKVERQFFDDKGRLYKKKEYIYEYRQ